MPFCALCADESYRPYLVITRLLGLPRDREAEFHRWALALLRFREDPAAGAKAAEELTVVLAPIVEARRREPRNDVSTALGTGGHCARLRRTAVGPFTDSEARRIDELPVEITQTDLMSIDEALGRI